MSIHLDNNPQHLKCPEATDRRPTASAAMTLAEAIAKTIEAEFYQKTGTVFDLLNVGHYEPLTGISRTSERARATKLSHDGKELQAKVTFDHDPTDQDLDDARKREYLSLQREPIVFKVRDEPQWYIVGNLVTGIKHYDIGLALIRRSLDRNGPLTQFPEIVRRNVLLGVFGRVEYPNRSEVEFRFQCLQQLETTEHEPPATLALQSLAEIVRNWPTVHQKAAQKVEDDAFGNPMFRAPMHITGMYNSGCTSTVTLSKVLDHWRTQKVGFVSPYKFFRED